MVGESSCGVAGRVVGCDFLNIEVNLLPRRRSRCGIVAWMVGLVLRRRKGESIHERFTKRKDNAELDSEELTDFEDVLEKMRCEEGFFFINLALSQVLATSYER